MPYINTRIALMVASGSMEGSHPTLESKDDSRMGHPDGFIHIRLRSRSFALLRMTKLWDECLSTSVLLRWCWLVGQVLVVEDGVEDQGVGADGFTPVDGVVAEEEDVALAEVGVDDDGVFGDGGGLVE
jgi:hypothetical protein